jgi:cyclophilin family peptidyl-prolyl cis-trans isomerase
MRKITMTFILLALVISCNDTAKSTSTTSKVTGDDVSAVIKTVHGNIKFKFYPLDAPNTVKRLKQLITEGFYNGLKFHRVIPGFVIQGGDPSGNGTGGSGKNLKAEFNSNKHQPGSVAMARSSNPDSADSQFYISLGSPSHLDGKYTIFGMVTSGMGVAKKIKKDDKMLQVFLEK